MMHFAFEGNIPYRSMGEFHWESRPYLGFNYNFGGGKNRELQRKQRDKTRNSRWWWNVLIIKIFIKSVQKKSERFFMSL